MGRDRHSMIARGRGHRGGGVVRTEGHRDGAATAIGTQPGLSGRPPRSGVRLGDRGQRSRQPLRNGRWTSRTRISADARGKSSGNSSRGARRTTDAEETRVFAREENHVLLRRSLRPRRRSASGGGGPSSSVLGFTRACSDESCSVCCSSWRDILALLVRAKFGVVFGMFLRHVRRESARLAASPASYSATSSSESSETERPSPFGFLGAFFGVCSVFFFEFGTADDGIGTRLPKFFVLGFDGRNRKRGRRLDSSFQLSVIPGGFKRCWKPFLGRLGDLRNWRMNLRRPSRLCEGAVLVKSRILTAARQTARDRRGSAAAWSGGRGDAVARRLKFMRTALFFVSLCFNTWKRPKEKRGLCRGF